MILTYLLCLVCVFFPLGFIFLLVIMSVIAVACSSSREQRRPRRGPVRRLSRRHRGGDNAQVQTDLESQGTTELERRTDQAEDASSDVAAPPPIYEPSHLPDYVQKNLKET